MSIKQISYYFSNQSIISSINYYLLRIYFFVFGMSQKQKSCDFTGVDRKGQQADISERIQYTNNVKARAAVMLIQATQFVQSKNIDRAKQLLVQIADSCMSVVDPDDQITKWIQISCTYLAILHKNMQQKKAKSMHNMEKKSSKCKQNIVILKYNKFLGQFLPDEQQEDLISQDILQYVSKINMILFGCQNVQNSHSLYVMFTSYWIPFTIAILLFVLAFVFLAGEKLIVDTQMDAVSPQFQITAIIIGILLVLPLLMIFLKVLQQKDNTFFQKKLGEEIKRINLDCTQRNNKLQFMMPHGGEINVRLGVQDPFVPDENQNSNPINGQVDQTPQDQLMDKIKGLTRQISKISGASIASFK